jgi:hypothetical protein
LDPAFPTEALLIFFQIKKWGMQTGANISQVFLSASGFLHLYFSLSEASSAGGLYFFSTSPHNHALTKIFVLSNIRFVSGGSA